MLELNCKYRGRPPLTFDGVNVSWPDFELGSKPSKRRKITVNIAEISAISLHMGGLVAYMQISFSGSRRKQRNFTFKPKDRLLAQMITNEILKAKANPESYVLPSVIPGSNQMQGRDPATIPPPLTGQPEESRDMEDNEAISRPTRVEQLKILSELRDNGTLTDIEFEEEKRRLLDT